VSVSKKVAFALLCLLLLIVAGMTLHYRHTWHGSSISYTMQSATGVQTIAITNTKIFASPYNWRSVGGSGTMQSNNVLPTDTTAITTWNCGAYLKLACTVASGGYIKLNCNTTRLQTLSAGVCPVLAWSVDGTAFQTQQLPFSASTYQLTLSSTAGAHTIIMFVDAVDLTTALAMGDRYTNSATGASDVTINGVELDAASTLNAPTVNSNNLLAFTDSTGEMPQLLSATLTISGQSASQSWVMAMLQQGYEVGLVGASGQGWAVNIGSGGNAYGNVPKLVDTVTPANSAWRNYSSGNSRLVGGLLVPTPNVVITQEGQNDGSTDPTTAIQAYFPSMRTAAGSSALLVDVIPFTGNQRTNITSAWNGVADTKSLLIDMGTDFGTAVSTGGAYTNSTAHLNLRGNTLVAARIAQKIQQAQSGSAVSGAKRRTQ
jgi:hypothetical protein